MQHFTAISSVLLNIIIYAGIVQGFYSAFILTHTKLRNPANEYLSYLLIVLSLSILHSVFVIPYFHQFHQIDFHLKEPFLLLAIPFLWLYVKKLNEPLFRFKMHHFLHFAPFLIVMLISAFYLFHSRKFGERMNSHAVIGNIILYVIALAQYVFYLVYILRIIRSFKTKALNELSNTENIDLAWFRVFLFIFLIVFVLLIGMMVIAIHKIEAAYFNPTVSLVFALAIYILGYKGLFQQTILLKQELEPISSAEKRKLDENKTDPKQLENLLNFMKVQKPFHDPELTLSSLAAMLDLTRNQLSELINSGTGTNFYDFVNTYRVEEVKQLMENPKYKDYTILAIAFEAGFPSKSTFNSIFKKFTGFTPTEYKKQNTKNLPD